MKELWWPLDAEEEEMREGGAAFVGYSNKYKTMPKHH
jgi:hypothetical protein